MLALSVSEIELDVENTELADEAEDGAGGAVTVSVTWTVATLHGVSREIKPGMLLSPQKP